MIFSAKLVVFPWKNVIFFRKITLELSHRTASQECPVELKATIDRWNKRWPGDRDGRDRAVKMWVKSTGKNGRFHGINPNENGDFMVISWDLPRENGDWKEYFMGNHLDEFGMSCGKSWEIHPWLWQWRQIINNMESISGEWLQNGKITDILWFISWKATIFNS